AADRGQERQHHPVAGQGADPVPDRGPEPAPAGAAGGGQDGHRGPGGGRGGAAVPVAAGHADRPRGRPRPPPARRRAGGLFPAALLPEDPRPFCLFLDDLPACSADVQKAFYPLLLERRLGEHALPAGSWVVAAGNRTEDRALVRDLSAALVNRLFLLQVRVDADEWFAWAVEQEL